MRKLIRSRVALLVCSPLLIAPLFVAISAMSSSPELQAELTATAMSIESRPILPNVSAPQFNDMDDECDCKIIEYVDVCGKDDPCSGADE